ncbi:helix-turn-helix domain-containing protein [Gordonia sp. C13]|uniref:helix-turn-helix domain-containing protein n=1 Tax=Gordonia sp. C13 TaxID=2935078 RepID=UPI0012B7A5F6|nr:helix-turn-helix transcriptional regulator [Gordonia sp. C13]MCK8616355.1 helix-turn-helix domain-containing protein [Gordonia sp. C13]
MTNDEAAPNTAAGEYLRAARRAADLTQPELAERSGVGVRTISLLETGRSSNVRIGTLVKLSRALSIDENDLTSAFFGGTQTQHSADRSAAPQNDRVHVPMPVDTLTAVFNAITTFLADDDSSAARNHVAAAAGELFTAYAIALLERAADRDATEQHGYLVSLIKMQTSAFPDDSDERNYLLWLVGATPDITAQERQRYEDRWGARIGAARS